MKIFEKVKYCDVTNLEQSDFTNANLKTTKTNAIAVKMLGLKKTGIEK